MIGLMDIELPFLASLLDKWRLGGSETGHSQRPSIPIIRPAISPHPQMIFQARVRQSPRSGWPLRLLPCKRRVPMRNLAFILLITATAFSQNLTEFGAVSAGSVVGGASGKATSNGISAILGKVDQQTAKAAKPQ